MCDYIYHIEIVLPHAEVASLDAAETAAKLTNAWSYCNPTAPPHPPRLHRAPCNPLIVVEG